MSDSLTQRDTPTPTPDGQDLPAKKNGHKSKLSVISERRELVWSLYRRNFRTSDIIKILTEKKLLVGVKAPYFLVRKDIRAGIERAREVRASGDATLAESIYIGRLEELYAIALLEKDVGVARQILHDWALAHGLKVEEPLSPLAMDRSLNLTQINVQVNSNGNGDPEQAYRDELARIGDEVARLVGPRRLDQGSSSTDEPD